MKTIKLFFTGFWSDFNINDNMFTKILRKKFNIVIDGEDPDFLICSPLGKPYEYMKFDCPRIMYSGEYLSPDFSAIDYFIGYDNIDFGDRCFRFPLYLHNSQCTFNNGIALTKDKAKQILQEKKYFCNYIFGHDTALGKREEILEKLSLYKRVECAGTHRNNMPDGQVYTYHTKKELMKLCKFSIAAESVSYPGFVSEKLAHAFRAHTIPIYYGAPDVGEDFNENAFINCMSYNNIDDAIEAIIEIDNNDDLYINMLCENSYNLVNYEEIMINKLESFLYNIFIQDKGAAYRRPRFYRAGQHESYLKEYNEFITTLPYRVWKKCK
ncbi:MAG: hypothetical protein J6A50_04370 [Clostridia bacterium]|nr:hypothetical protein [Clostridia bacterium]